MSFVLHLPDVVGLKELSEGVVFLGSLHLLYLRCHAVVVGRSLHVADYTEGYREAVAVTHEGELQLQGVVLAVCVVHEDVLLCDAVLTNLHNLQSEALLYESELTVLTEDERFAVLYVDGVLRTSGAVIYRSVGTVVEHHAVLQYLSDAGTLMCVGSLQHLHGVLTVGCHGASEEVSASAEAELCRAERVFHCSVRA